MISSERLLAIMEYLEKDGVVKVKELAKRFDSSETTIRRDLELLEQQGKLKRVSGGALRLQVAEILSSIDEPPMDEKVHRQEEVKRALCAKANSMVNDGECIFVDGGTTLLPLLELLSQRRVTIVTHNQLALRVMKNCKATLIMLGGEYSSVYEMTTGPMTIDELRRFSFDRAFLGCASVDVISNRMYTTEIETASVKTEAMKLSNKNYLLVDKTKVNRKGFYMCACLDEFDSVITDYSGEGLTNATVIKG
ncbi:MAG: DeoR/GlpR transcriptional regulator [Erysipelotrichaceae bacterium]|nr:DeoR/GlpR transcriptional regulator [Erysipelotrichaceae bacterium]